MANIEWFNDYDRGLNRAREEGTRSFWIFSRRAEAGVPSWVP